MKKKSQKNKGKKDQILKNMKFWFWNSYFCRIYNRSLLEEFLVCKKKKKLDLIHFSPIACDLEGIFFLNT